MIITCEECTTRFQLDDARIPVEGAKVRCSKCRHAFFVKPEVSSGDPVGNAVAQALADDEDTTPDADSSQSLDPAQALRGADDQSAQEAMDEFEESDWEFNTDASEADSGEDLSSFQQPPGLDLAEESGLDLAEDEGPIPEPDDAPDLDAAQEAVDDLLGGGDEAGADDSDIDLGGANDVSDDVDELFDTTPDVDHGIDALLDGTDEDPSEVDLRAGAEPGAPELGDLAGPDPVESALQDLGLGDDTAPDLGLEGLGIGEADGPDATETAPDLGEPDKWDFFAGESETAPAPGDSQPVAIGRIGKSAIEQPAQLPMQEEAETSSITIWGRRAAQGVGWAAVAALAVAILYPALRGAPSVAPAAPATQKLAGLVASSLEGHWVENLTGGSLYVISGELRSVVGGGRPPGVQLAVRLFDASGRLLTDEAGVIGPALSELQLREEAASALRETQAAGALSLAGRFFSDSRSIRIHAVLEGVPAAAERFDLVAVPVELPPPAAPETEPEAPAEGAVKPRQEPA